MNEDDLRAEYSEVLPRLGELRASLVASLQRFEIAGAELKSRVKTWESIREQMARRRGQHLDDIQDLVGVRLIVPDTRTLLDASAAIQQALQVTHLQSGQSTAYFSIRSAGGSTSLSAEIQVLTRAEEARLVLEHELAYRGIHGGVPPGSPAYAGTSQLDAILTEFEALIERTDVHEKRDVHPVIKAHAFILFPNPDAVTSEVPIGLGTEFRIDFLVQKPDGSYLLIEIENPRQPLFTKGGDFSAGVNHALRQVEDWQEWIEANLPTVDRYFPGIRAPEAWVVIGRDRGLPDAEKRRLARRNINMRGRVAIKTYDDLLRDAKAYVRSIRAAFGGK